MKVGELAKQTGVSVRTLHYYDEISLLEPSHRNDAGHRLYTAADIVRLQQIMSLRQVGFSLEEIRECLEQSDFSPYRVIQLHMSRLREQMELQRKLYNRLEAIAASLRSTEEISVEELMQTIEVISMFEKYYTPEQLEELKERRQMLGEEKIHQVQGEWQELIEQVRAEMEKGTEPTSETVQFLAKRWRRLIQEFTGGNPEIEKSLNTIYQQEGAANASRNAIDSDTCEYISKAMAVLK
ncbi:MAG: MerR family transcriptional regulator [Symploca sp. SIO2C1]|nr:MerR family transcriptional regulator [Symploca sp. SIO2C1]